MTTLQRVEGGRTLKVLRASVPGSEPEIHFPQPPQPEPGGGAWGMRRGRGLGFRASEAPDPDNSGNWEPFVPNPHVQGINN